MTVLAINAGSSSIRLALVALDGEARTIATFHAGAEAGNHANVLLRFLAAHGQCPPALVAHRLVHGGPHMVHPIQIDAGVEQQLEAAVPLAPLHVPAALDWIRAARQT